MTRSKDNTVVVSDPFARRLMVRYLDQRHGDIESLRAALVERDFESIRKKGHNLFGSGSAYGLDRVSELGADLEKTAEKGDGEAVAELIDLLDAYVRNVRVV
jgi:HPt (histidine-containing phosphotransfer) domain-containing protein